MIALEYEPAQGKNGLATDKDKVSAFLDIATEFSGCSLVILCSRFLRNGGAFGVKKGVIFKECTLSNADREAVLKACTSHGHLSVLFVHPGCEELSRRFLDLGFYGEPRQVNFGTSDSPLDAEAILSLESFLMSASGKAVQEMLAFAHDAGAFYRIYPWQKQP